MMRIDTCVITTKDFAMLEALYNRSPVTSGKWRALLYRKLDTASIVFSNEVLPKIATLNSRVCFRAGDGKTDIRVLSHERTALPVGALLPLTSLRGLALFGLREGQAITVSDDDGPSERILLEKIAYQPEAARLAQEAASRAAVPQSRRAAFRVISGGRDVSSLFVRENFPSGSKDPGPSAA